MVDKIARSVQSPISSNIIILAVFPTLDRLAPRSHFLIMSFAPLVGFQTISGKWNASASSRCQSFLGKSTQDLILEKHPTQPSRTSKISGTVLCLGDRNLHLRPTGRSRHACHEGMLRALLRRQALARVANKEQLHETYGKIMDLISPAKERTLSPRISQKNWFQNV